MADRLSPPLSLTVDAAQALTFRDKETGEQRRDELADLVESALSFGAQQAAGLATFDDASRRDPTLSPSARALTMRAAAERIGPRVAERLDAAILAVERAREAVLAASSAPPFDPTTAAFEVEVRAGLRALAPKARTEAIGEALANDDVAALRAVLTAPHLATGLSRDELEMRRAEYRRRHHPGALERIERLEKTERSLRLAAGSFAGFIAKAAGGDELAARQAATRAAAAALEGEP